MSGKLKDIVQQVSLSSSEITRGSQEIANGNSDLSKRSEEQATSLRTTAASVTEMTSNVKVAAASAESANTLSKQTQDHAQKGGEIVKRAIASMGEINDSSKKIADIIGMINEIAFQTNLLALNAAVEAARAGEQGRGFAVVAQEVRSLAQRSATAADEIKKLIEDSLNKIGDGSKSVEDTGEALRQIQESVGRVTGSVADINNSSQEQALGIERVNQNISNIDSATNANLALVDSAATTSESMAAEARRMYELMQFFKLSKSA
jgi:methyl-accepting chemotaxis protein